MSEQRNPVVLSRRRLITLGGSGALGLVLPGAAHAELTDGVGPNRGIVARGKRRKQTCENTAVPLSDAATRLAAPDDFGIEHCAYLEDSHEGPYFTCAPAPGKDIRYGEVGQPLTVALRLINGECQPIPGGVVDVWACNATGHYSGYDQDPNRFPPLFRAMLFGHIKPDLATRFCRGALSTDADGIAEFDSIYPGFYYGQPVHLHFKVHVGDRVLVTSQARFDEDWNDRIMQTAPYNAPRPITRTIEASGFPQMRLIERGDRLLAVLNLAVAT